MNENVLFDILLFAMKKKIDGWYNACKWEISGGEIGSCINL